MQTDEMEEKSIKCSRRHKYNTEEGKRKKFHLDIIAMWLCGHRLLRMQHRRITANLRFFGLCARAPYACTHTSYTIVKQSLCYLLRFSTSVKNI